MLIPEQAAPLVGVPAAQLKRWAWDRVGPKNSGTRWKPKFREEDLRAWADEKAKQWALCRAWNGPGFVDDQTAALNAPRNHPG